MSKVFNLLGAVALVVAVTVPAWAQESAFTQRGFECLVDPEDAGINLLAAGVDPATLPPNGISTTQTEMKCPGNTSTTGGSARTTLNCIAPISGWSGSSQQAKGFECVYPRNYCGLPGQASTFDTSMQVNGDGRATLSCICDPDAPNSTCSTVN